jgi:hypothetical protein
MQCVALPEALVLRGEVDGRAERVCASVRAYALDRAEIVMDCLALLGDSSGS